MEKSKPCKVCPIESVCIQSVTPKPCPVENAPDITIKSNTITKENK